MDYKIVETWIDNDRLCCHVLISDGKLEELVTVPVKLPKDEQAVIDAINLRCIAEQAKRDYVTLITPVKTAVDEKINVLTAATAAVK